MRSGQCVGIGAALAVALWGCGGTDASGEGAGGAAADAGAGGSVGAIEGAGASAGGAVAACDVPAPRVACPEPGADTFGVTPTGFTGLAADFDTTNPQIRHRAEDLLANEAADLSLAGRMARGRGLGWAPYAQANVALFTWNARGAWQSLGETVTDDGGLFSLWVPGDVAFGAGSHDYYAVLAGDASCARGGIFLWPAGTRIVLTDIDGTLTTSDAELLQQISDPTHDPAMYPDANALMRRWAEKGYRIVYLTARPHEYRAITDAWLVAHDFPNGPIVTADALVLGEAARTYKRAAIGHLKDELGWSIEVAYGNATSDIDAYADNALPLERTFIIGEHAGVGGTAPIAEAAYKGHLATWAEPYPAAADAFADAPLCLP